MKTQTWREWVLGFSLGLNFVLVISFSLLAATGRLGSPPSGPFPTKGDFERQARLILGEVDLPKEEEDRIVAIMATSFEESKRQMEARNTDRETAIKNLILHPEDDSAAATAREHALSLHMDMTTRMIQAIRDASGELTPDQRAKLADVIAKHRPGSAPR